MTERPRPAPERLTSESHRAGSPEARAADYLRSAARAAADLGPASLARVAARLSNAGGTPVRARLHWKTIAAVVALAVCAGGATGASVWVMAPRLRARWAPSASPPSPVAPASPASRGRPVSSRAAGAPPPEQPVPVQESRTAHVGHRASAAPRVVAPSPGAEALARESALLGLALRRLRREHDPRGALAALDEHAAQFAHGALRPEAEIARIEVLLTLDRRAEALAILNGMTFPDSARGRELLVVRAELRAAGGCREAVADFTRALGDAALEAPLQERALHGRAACYLTTGNRPAANADLDAYLRRFPDGRFAAESRRSRSDGVPSPNERFRPASDTGTGGATR